MSKTIQLSLISVALISSLCADNQYTLENIEVSSSQGITLNKKDVTDNITIIAKKAIEESRVTSLTEALSQLGNITISQSGGTGQQASMFVRGMDSRRILVLIDGVRYNNPTAINAVAELSQVMLYNVEQIEIIKGAQSGVWGSDASGGVINIITSKAKKGVHAVANVEYGSFDSKKTSIQASYATDKYDILIGGLHINNDGFSAVEPTKADANYGKRYDELGLEKDKYINTTLNAKLGYNLTKEDRIEATLQMIDGDADFDGSTGYPLYAPADSSVENSKIKNNFYTLAYKHKGTIHDITAQYNLSTFDKDFKLASGDSNFKGSVNEVKVDDKITYMKDSFLRVGSSYQLFNYEKQAGTEDKNYNALSAFATNYNKMQFFEGLNTIITESVRYDKFSEFDDALTGKIGAKQFIFKDYYVSANVGTGYNAPTIDQVYGNPAWSIAANPNLKPENSFTTDLTLGSDIVWITAFYNEIDNLIDYVSGTPAIYKNLDGKSTFQGIEIGYEDYLFETLGLAANYTYVKTEDATGKELARRPKTQIDVKATYYISEEFNIGINAQHIGTRYDRADKQGAQTGEYTIANLSSNVKVNKYITVYGKINNITDEYYQVVDGYATAGRSLYLGLNAKY